MKIWAIGDLHLGFNVDKPMNIFGDVWDGYVDEIKKNWNKKVGKNDVGVLCGDLSWAMRIEQAQADIDYLKELKGSKIIIRGNHDYWWSTITKVREALPEKCYALQNDCVKIKNVIFCGTRGWRVPESWQKSDEKNQKILENEYNRLKLAFEAAKKMVVSKKDKIVCIIHYPPFNSKRNDSGFTKLIDEYQPKAVIYGHLHGKNCKADLLVIKNKIKYYLTSCDLVKHKVVRIHI